MIRVSTLLKPETLEKVQDEANTNSISIAAVIRQKVERWYTNQDMQINFVEGLTPEQRNELEQEMRKYREGK